MEDIDFIVFVFDDVNLRQNVFQGNRQKRQFSWGIAAITVCVKFTIPTYISNDYLIGKFPNLDNAVLMNRLHAIYLFLFFLVSNSASAFDGVTVHYLGIEQGLSNNAVTCIYQDYNGFMWFGTYDGLNRYDGYSFKIFRNVIGDSNSLGDNHIFSIAADADHNMWIGNLKGISIYNPIKNKFYSPGFIPWDQPGLQYVKEGAGIIKAIHGGAFMMVGTQNNGLLVFEKPGQPGFQVPLPGSSGKKGDYCVTSIQYEPSENTAWIFVLQSGLYKYDIKNKSLQLVSAAIKQANCLKADGNGNVWLGNGNGLYRYDISSGSYSQNFMPAKNLVVGIYADKQNTLWISSDGGGAWYLPPGSDKLYPYFSETGSELINSNVVYDIYVDNDGRKWIATLRGGINIIEPRAEAFKKITYNIPGQNNIINNFILSFCEDEKRNVWVGTDGAGLRYWDRNKNIFSRYIHSESDATSISGNFITNIAKDFNDDIWISTWFGGINRLKKSSQSFEHFTCTNPVTGLEENNVWLVYLDKQQRLWASTTNNGTLYLLNRATNKFELFNQSIVNVQCLSEDSQNDFWAGNYTSLYKIDRTKQKYYTYLIGYPVRCIYEDRKKNFWIGTEGGGLLLFNRKTASYQRFTTSEGLPNNTILRLLEDKKGNLWISTYNGLGKFDPLDKTCKNFSQSDGLQSNQFSFNAALALQSGEFLFGGIKGFNIFYPDSVYNKNESARLFLTGLKINNTPVEENASYVTKRSLDRIESISVPYNQANISLDFIDLQYSGTDKIKYAYLLEGWDKTWSYVNNIRSANYSKLGEGNYTFKIKVASQDGVWGTEYILLRIKVLPPWYRSWWAYLLYGISILGLIYEYMRYNKRQERLRYEVKLAHLDNEKEKELTEKKISYFTHISHEFRTPLTLIINPLKELIRGKSNEDDSRKDMLMIYRNTRRLLSLVDQLLLFRKVESVDQQMRIEHFDIIKMCNEVFLSFSQHAVSKNISFTFNHSDQEILIYADKEKIEIILFNLLSNAFKYTGVGGSIRLEMYESETDVQIAVKDTGIGIPSDTGNRLFESFSQLNQKDKASRVGFGVGLYVSQKLAQAHGGKLFYTSEQGSGTDFRLLLLKGKEQFLSQYTSENYAGGETILHELVEEPGTDDFSSSNQAAAKNNSEIISKLRSELPSMVIVDDNAEIRAYVCKIFANSFNIYEADDGGTGYDLVVKESPDIVISDIRMTYMTGIELCQKIKSNPSLAHIPIILLTADSSDEIKLEGIEVGAEDYITKPFDQEIILARVRNILKGRTRLQEYFFNAVTLKPNFNIPGEHKEFIEKCISIVEKHLDNPEFNISTFSREIGMSHPSLYKKIKAVSGLTVNVFIRYLRLRKASELLINSDKTIVEITYITGFNDVRYFREQFYKLFQMNPSDYIKRYRKVLSHRPAEEEED